MLMGIDIAIAPVLFIWSFLGELFWDRLSGILAHIIFLLYPSWFSLETVMEMYLLWQTKDLCIAPIWFSVIMFICSRDGLRWQGVVVIYTYIWIKTFNVTKKYVDLPKQQ